MTGFVTGKSKPGRSYLGEFAADDTLERIGGRRGSCSAASSSVFRKELVVLDLDLGPRRDAATASCDALVIVRIA